MSQEKGLPNQVKLYRLYFNSTSDAPNCWSMDEGTIHSELQIASIKLINVQVRSRLNLAADNVREPKAWFEVIGTLEVHENEGILTGSSLN
jgi:hypothetical protein